MEYPVFQMDLSVWNSGFRKRYTRSFDIKSQTSRHKNYDCINIWTGVLEARGAARRCSATKRVGTEYVNEDHICYY